MDEKVNYNQPMCDPNCGESMDFHGNCDCVTQCVTETMCICNMKCLTDSRVCYKGVEDFAACGMCFIKVGYEVCIKYIDCDGNKKSKSKQGKVLFFANPDMLSPNLKVHISNPPCLKVCKDETTAKFKVTLCW
jgi:peptide deformylase